MDVNFNHLKQALEPRWSQFGRESTLDTADRAYKMMQDDSFKETEAAM